MYLTKIRIWPRFKETFLKGENNNDEYSKIQYANVSLDLNQYFLYATELRNHGSQIKKNLCSNGDIRFFAMNILFHLLYPTP